MNHIKNKKLKNKYFILRHGESEAFKLHLVLSKPENGISKFGLTKLGKEQVKNSLEKFILKHKGNFLNKETIIYSSDFKRAKESAEIVVKILKIKKINFTELLRERNFGDFENTKDENYRLAWKWDRSFDDKELKKHKIENTRHVEYRTSKLISKLEKEYSNRNILLVAHCDTLQILTTAFKNKLPNLHRSLKKLELAEIRELKIKK
jgi:probable phosphoglycerate mutase